MTFSGSLEYEKTGITEMDQWFINQGALIFDKSDASKYKKQIEIRTSAEKVSGRQECYMVCWGNNL